MIYEVNTRQMSIPPSKKHYLPFFLAKARSEALGAKTWSAVQATVYPCPRICLGVNGLSLISLVLIEHASNIFSHREVAIDAATISKLSKCTESLAGY